MTANGPAPPTPPPAAEDAGTPMAAPTAAEELAALRRKAAEADQWREQCLRARADYANLEKRQARAMEEFRRYALRDFVAALLPGLDDLERAVNAARPASAPTPLETGVRMALERLHGVLRQAGVEPVPAEGEPFDPLLHEAVACETRSDVAAPTATEQVRAGYALGDRVIRPAQVKVAIPPPREAASDAPDRREEEDSEGDPDADL